MSRLPPVPSTIGGKLPVAPMPKPVAGSARPSSASSAPFALDLAPRQSKRRGARVITYAVSGWGKTSVGANAKKPVIFMATGEKGYDTLLAYGRVPQVAAIDIDSWPNLLAATNALAANPGDRETAVYDAVGGFEKLLQQWVCDNFFDGDWGETGYSSYGKGNELASREWLKFLAALERLSLSGIDVILLGHAKVVKFENPTGVNYDRYQCDCHEKVWASTAKFCEAVLFGTYVNVIVTAKGDANKNAVDKRGKGMGLATRVVYCEPRDAFDAKNQYGMPPAIDIPEDHTQGYAAIFQHINKETA